MCACVTTYTLPCTPSFTCKHTIVPTHTQSPGAWDCRGYHQSTRGQVCYRYGGVQRRAAAADVCYREAGLYIYMNAYSMYI